MRAVVHKMRKNRAARGAAETERTEKTRGAKIVGILSPGLPPPSPSQEGRVDHAVPRDGPRGATPARRRRPGCPGPMELWARAPSSIESWTERQRGAGRTEHGTVRDPRRHVPFRVCPLDTAPLSAVSVPRASRASYSYPHARACSAAVHLPRHRSFCYKVISAVAAARAARLMARPLERLLSGS